MQSILFHFEGLSGPSPTSPLRYGVATYVYDGVGEYRCTAIEEFVDGARRKRGKGDATAETRVYLPGSEGYAEIVKVLEAERGDDIAARINEDLERGGYMALHGRSMPRDGVRVERRAEAADAADPLAA